MPRRQRRWSSGRMLLLICSSDDTVIVSNARHADVIRVESGFPGIGTRGCLWNIRPRPSFLDKHVGGAAHFGC
jgi:hypothetical protein